MFPRNQLLLLIVAVLGGLAQDTRAEPPSGLVVPIDGEPFVAHFVKADAQWRWTFEAGENWRTLPAADLVRWGVLAEPAKGPVTVLAVGSLVPAEPIEIDDDGRLVLESDSLGTLRLPRESLAGVIFAWPNFHGEQDRLIDRLLRIGSDESATAGSSSSVGKTSDLVLLVNGDEMGGVITGLDRREIRVDVDGATINLPKNRVRGVVFQPAGQVRSSSSTLRAWVGLDDGTLLPVDRLSLEDGTLRLSPVGAGRASPPWTTQAGHCIFLHPLGGRAVYLSDRVADRYRHIPFLELPWTYHNDRNVLGGRLRASGRTYLKGLGVHSAARLTYHLKEPIDRFEAALSLDDAAGGGGSVRYHVLVDGQRRFSSGPVRGGDRPITARVDLSGAKRLDLVVDFGERIDQLDYADWLDARLIRADADYSPQRHGDH